MTLREKLKALEELQKVDLEVHDLRTQYEGLPRRQQQLESSVADAKKGYEAEKARLLDNEKERRQVDSLLQMERDKVKKWEGRLGEIKTPREYAALSREIDIAKKANEAQTEQIKLLTESAAGLQRSLEDKESALHEVEEKSKSELSEIKKRSRDFEERLRALELRRGEEAKKVDPALLSKYENIRRRRAGVAVVQVVGTTCKGCNMNIPPQLANVLRRADSVEICPNCKRIIYSAEALNPGAPAA